jgi:hypothetical protein
MRTGTHQEPVVHLRDAGVRLGKHHLDEVDGHLKERPLVVHRLHQRQVAGVLVQGGLDGTTCEGQDTRPALERE